MNKKHTYFDLFRNLTVSAALLSTSLLSAQNAPIDFETSGNGATWTWTTFENVTNPALEIIANPDASGINTSATVAKFTALNGGQPWAGCETTHGAGIGTFTLSASNAKVKIMVWKSVISDVGIKFATSTNASTGEIKVANTKTGEWEELTFDFSAKIAETNDQIIIFPDFQARTTDNVCYFDNITFSASGTTLAEPTAAAPTPTALAANVISMFSNAYTNVTVNTWRTDWSAGVLTDMQVAGNDVKKYSSLDFIGIEAVGANVINASTMEKFNIDVWTPNVTTFYIKLVDFGADGAYAGGDDKEHELSFTPTDEAWNTYSIALSDFTGLTTKSHIAQIVLKGLPTGTGVVYVDNVYFSKTPTSISNVSSAGLEIYPNPAAGNVNIQAASAIESIVIYNAMGQVVYSGASDASSLSIDTTDFAKGVYTVQVNAGGKMLNSKLIID